MRAACGVILPASPIAAPRAVALLAAIVLSAAGCRETGPPTRPHLVEQARVAMGSELRLTAWTADEPAAHRAFDAVFREFERLEGLLSVWRQGSAVGRVNAAAGVRAIQVEEDVLAVLRVARQVSDLTDGKFDVTFGALADAWRFDHDQDNRIPTEAAIASRLPLVDYRAVEVDERGRTVLLARAGMRLHLGGIGKGYAVDRAVDILRARGLRDFLVQAGGDLYAGGGRDGQPWRLGINDPRGRPGQSFARLDLTDRTLSTSGDYERFFLSGGTRYHHLLDPDTGQPARGCRSVTIVAERAVLADALSTGVFILGPAAGMDLVERLPEVEAVIVGADNQVIVSSGLRDRIEMLAAPTSAP
jgi:thiamine biosynthesis lipoprotein